MLPFYISTLLGLKSKTHGFALATQAGIRLVFREASEIEEAPDQDAESLMIEWANLASWQAQHGLIADAFKIKVHSVVGDEPDGKNDNVIELEIQKRDRAKLDRFAKLVEEYVSGSRKDDTDDVLDDVRDLLDRM